MGAMNIPEEAIVAGAEAFRRRRVWDSMGMAEDVAETVLRAAAPLIAARGALEERVKIVAEIRKLAENVRKEAWTRTAGIALGSIIDEVADKINLLPDASGVSEWAELMCPECGARPGD